jgi:CO/xanthine dehydrogenase FAD-binding subunit
VSVSAGVVDTARLALIGAWPQPVRLARAANLLDEQPLTGSLIEIVAQAVVEEVHPRGDYLGSADYRRAMAGVLTRRALEACLGEGKGYE